MMNNLQIIDDSILIVCMGKHISIKKNLGGGVTYLWNRYDIMSINGIVVALIIQTGLPTSETVALTLCMLDYFSCFCCLLLMFF